MSFQGCTTVASNEELGATQQCDIDDRCNKAQCAPHAMQFAPLLQQAASFIRGKISAWLEQLVIRWLDDDEGERNNRANEEGADKSHCAAAEEPHRDPCE